MEDPARRKLVAPTIRAATDCIARETLSESNVVERVREGTISQILSGPIQRCQGSIDFLMSEFDRVYYVGAGSEFVRGAYRSDLPRAVLARISSEVSRRGAEQDRRLAALRREQEEEARSAELRRAQERAAAERSRAEDERKAAEVRAETERQQAEYRAAAEKRDAERKVELARLENERKAEQIKQDELKRQQLEAAGKATDLLKDRMYECATRETNDLVRSGESADIVASAAMTLCSREIDQALDGIINVRRIEVGTTVGPSETDAIKTMGRSALKDRVLAMVVKAKAARVGGKAN